jgi:hypothetical protein
MLSSVHWTSLIDVGPVGHATSCSDSSMIEVFPRRTLLTPRSLVNNSDRQTNESPSGEWYNIMVRILPESLTSYQNKIMDKEGHRVRRQCPCETVVLFIANVVRSRDWHWLGGGGTRTNTLHHRKYSLRKVTHKLCSFVELIKGSRIFMHTYMSTFMLRAIVII